MPDSPIPRLNKISDYVFYHAEHQPDMEALVWQEERIDYQEFAARVESTSRALLAAGISRGDRIALLGMPRPEYFIVMLAAVDIGAIWMGMHPRYRLAEFRHVVARATPTLIFAFEEIEGRCYHHELSCLLDEHDCVQQVVVFDQPQPQCGIPFAQFMEKASAITTQQLQAARRKVATDDSAVIIFTSGTTGQPKGAMNSHYGLVHCAHIQFDRWPGVGIRVLQNMPINHIANIGMMSSYALVAGGTLVFMDRFDAGGVLDIIEQEKITFWLQSPIQFHLAAGHARFDSTDFSSLQYMIWGGGALPRHLIERLYGLGPRLAVAYGMTELTAYATYSDPDADIDTLASTVGRPEPRYDLRLMKQDQTPAGVGESGEIQARGRWLMNGYFNQPQATAEAYTADGWFRTGDVAQLCADGNWSLVGRLTEMYKSGGYNIYPREIEIVIEAHPQVALTAVLGVADETYDEVGYAFVEPIADSRLQPQQLDDWCRQRLANYKIPKTFEIMAQLPRLPIGKIDKQQLRRQLQGQADD